MISLIMPVYIDTVQKQEFLNEAVRSIQQQTMDDWELILMDDASDFIPIIEQPDERIRRFRLTNRSGPALARNTGVALASYEAILPLDADDQLAQPETLEQMYRAWEADKKRVIYGDVQRVELIENEWRIAKTINLPNYTFELSLKLSGIMPVSCLHSIECHLNAGGWKKELEFGLEDIEYWIAAGKAGFCGQHIPVVTLLYRKHEDSRAYNLRFVNQQEKAMRDKIMSLHDDVYNGRYPMGCCGGGGGRPTPIRQINNNQPVITPLNDAREDEKVWVQYNGSRQATFQVQGNGTRTRYPIHGPGHKFEVYIKDVQKFQALGRGRDFVVGVAKPTNEPTEPIKEIIEEPTNFQGGQPEVAQVERLDKKALAT